MSEIKDPISESKRLIDIAESSDWYVQGEHGAHTDRAIAMAQVQASLALAEEKRTANLIAYWSALTEGGIGSAYTNNLRDLIDKRVWVDDSDCDHESRCCTVHNTHTTPNVGCILR